MSKITGYTALVSLFVLSVFAQPVLSEQIERDMYATVSVNPIFTLSLDNAVVNFGYVEPGKPVELKETTYYNSVTCNANKGKTWYLKVSIMGEIEGPTVSVPLSALKCKVYSSTGDGVFQQDSWLGLTGNPQVIYTSGSQDNTGEDVIIKFKYRLELPDTATAGNYRAKLLYTMTDIP